LSQNKGEFIVVDILVVATSAVVGGTSRANGQAGGVAGSADTAGLDIAVIASAAETGRWDAVVATTAHNCLSLHVDDEIVVEKRIFDLCRFGYGGRDKKFLCCSLYLVAIWI
jgi:hypothetical protein